jgi:hypothetical protein
MSTPFRHTFTLTHVASGSGTEWVALEGLPDEGRLDGVQIRRDAADTITDDVTPYWVTDADVDAEPADEDVVAKSSVVTLTASALAASLDSDFDNPRGFDKGLNMGGNFTFNAAGTSTTHWTVWGVWL